MNMGTAGKEASQSLIAWEELWLLGCSLEALAFQNQRMDQNRLDSKTEPNHYIYMKRVESAYKIPRKAQRSENTSPT